VNATHLITLSEIFSGMLPSAETTDSGSPHNLVMESKYAASKKTEQNVESKAVKDTQIIHKIMEILNKSLQQIVDTISECLVTTDKYSVENSQRADPMPL